MRKFLSIALAFIILVCSMNGFSFTVNASTIIKSVSAEINYGDFDEIFFSIPQNNCKVKIEIRSDYPLCVYMFNSETYEAYIDVNGTTNYCETLTLPKGNYTTVTTGIGLAYPGKYKFIVTNETQSVGSVKLSSTLYTYDGKVKTPSVTVKDSKGKTLRKNTDYTVSYASGRKNVGKYAVKITFKGNYSGSKTLYFTINPKGTSISKITAAKKGFKVYWKKQSIQTTGYQIQYSTSSKFSNAKTVTLTKNSYTSKSISKLSAKKKYYVRVRTYKKVGSTYYYSSWSKARYVTTKK